MCCQLRDGVGVASLRSMLMGSVVIPVEVRGDSGAWHRIPLSEAINRAIQVAQPGDWRVVIQREYEPAHQT